MTNPHFFEMLKMMEQIHQKKAADYSSDATSNPLENFERSNIVAEWFPNEYKSFGVLIGTKLARLGALLTKGAQPNNESIDDSFLDLATYCVLMYSFYKNQELASYRGENFLSNQTHYKQGTLGAALGAKGINSEFVSKCPHTRVDMSWYCIRCGIALDKSDDYTYNPALGEFLRIK